MTPCRHATQTKSGSRATDQLAPCTLTQDRNITICDGERSRIVCAMQVS